MTPSPNRGMGRAKRRQLTLARLPLPCLASSAARRKLDCCNLNVRGVRGVLCVPRVLLRFES